jgi:hypothetical protein
MTPTGLQVPGARAGRRVVGVVALVSVAAFGLGVVMAGTRGSGAAKQGAPVVVAGPSVVASAGREDRSRDGALAKAVQYATLLSRLFPMDPARARRLAADAASDAFRPGLVTAVDAELVPLQRKLAKLPGATAHRQSVLATRVDSYSDRPADAGRARVSVWVMLTLGQHTESGAADRADEQANAVASFGTVVLDLVWERGAWRLDGTAQRPGPTPLLDGRPQTTDEFSGALAGFADWRPA